MENGAYVVLLLSFFFVFKTSGDDRDKRSHGYTRLFNQHLGSGDMAFALYRRNFFKNGSTPSDLQTEIYIHSTYTIQNDSRHRRCQSGSNE
ncbi:hypothetical protein OUZ56_027895 [Daphnia magna]|uniref:Uncharacterized protein n=1 Tax=Daphnia magna TaxID=35525 RepID=A0ABR0B288_9CRUS|nr:hypothetical protein OUZ56_027895 [Daphnia magna]